MVQRFKHINQGLRYFKPLWIQFHICEFTDPLYGFLLYLTQGLSSCVKIRNIEHLYKGKGTRKWHLLLEQEKESESQLELTVVFWQRFYGSKTFYQVPWSTTKELFNIEVIQFLKSCNAMVHNSKSSQSLRTYYTTQLYTLKHWLGPMMQAFIPGTWGRRQKHHIFKAGQGRKMYSARTIQWDPISKQEGCRCSPVAEFLYSMLKALGSIICILIIRYK